MARSRKHEQEAGPSLPPYLEALRETAAEHVDPGEPEGNDQDLPKLWELLRPQEIVCGVLRPKSPDQRAVRQPMLMLAWNAGAGRWGVSVSDKLLKVRVSGLVESLAQSLQQFEALLQTNAVQVSQTRKRG
jgi:hypothetical protein